MLRQHFSPIDDCCGCEHSPPIRCSSSPGVSMQFAKRRTTIAALLASATIATPAWAQEEQPTGYETEVVVTAQKREENLQDVPISIQALGSKKLEDLNISNIEEYTQLLPSVAFQTSEPGVTVVYMRGVASGGDGNHSGSLPSVGSYLD